ncbi:aminotransferase class I/II-fold pyridoxal phosphate-dependent enzyme [Peptoniphilus catoniae]|uniref:methionine gamma-lyase family protein n=1 Tax=Peptoniphilus catoniae TaxID=1660341 RepID=UPI0010FE8187|nr:methionine gamma-lyase family protein [Peptoniphilus catoniae]
MERNKLYSILDREYKISKKVYDFIETCEKELEHKFRDRKDISQYNQIKILKAMQECKLQSTDFNWTTGYGYGDIGREKVEKIYSLIFNTEDGLVRPNIVSGTHAISLSLFSCLERGDHLLYITGSPYDTLQKVIGIKGDAKGSLIEKGVEYSELDLKNNSIDIENLDNKIRKTTKVIGLQRSTGYSDRRALTVDELAKAIKYIKEKYPNIITFVDNCYGEFTETVEPTDYGADLIAGSLIKNPGGGLAYSGGYVVGKKDLIERVANRLTAPGIGKDCGLSFGMTRQILQGLFISPKVVEDAVNSALLFSVAFEKLGFRTIPKSTDKRSDIILAIELKDPELLKKFCRAIQESSPVDSHFIPEPWDMPGYEDKVIMAAGDFIEGSSIELSADGPLREPYMVYYQGGLTYYHSKFALAKILSEFM